MALSNLARAKEFCLNAVRAIHQAGGIGLDDYWTQPTRHPMADAKLLSTLCALRRSALISAGLFAEQGKAAIQRLEETALPMGTGRAWGLNFPWDARQAPADEPYLVTTALVAEAMGEAKHLGLAAAEPLLGDAMAGLGAWPRVMGLPVYSPTIARPVVNTSVLWAAQQAVYGQLTEDDRGAVLDLMAKTLFPSIGWRYDPESPVIDLLHTCYIVRAARRIGQAVENQAAAALAAFAFPGRLIDHISLGSADQLFEATGRTAALVHGDFLLTTNLAPARPWSIGETLVMIAELAEGGEHKAYWLSLLRVHLAAAVQLYTAEDGAPLDTSKLRHTTHLTHGFARALEVFRANAEAAAEARPAPTPAPAPTHHANDPAREEARSC